MITITTVCKTSTVYKPFWVDKMKRALEKHLSIPFQFVPLTDSDHDYPSHKLEYDNPGYWNKIELFKPGLYEGPTLFIDLDNVITGDLASMINAVQGRGFSMWRGRVTEKSPVALASSTLMYWDKRPESVWMEWNTVNNKGHWYKKYKHGRQGDQAFIRDNAEYNFIQNWYIDAEQQIVSIKDKESINLYPDHIMVIFSGSKNPQNCYFPSIKSNWHNV